MSMLTRWYRLSTVCAAAVVVLLLAGCATRPAADPVPSASDSTARQLLTTPAGVTVLDDGSGPQLCLGAIAESLPPQCGGAEVVGWDWTDWTGSYEQVAGVRWGQFTLTGTYDADGVAFTPETVTPWLPGDEPEGEGAADFDFSTPCTAPDGGWRVLDPLSTTDATMDRVLERAAALDGYAIAWVDRSRVPSAGANASPEEQLAETAPFPELTIINVKVVGGVPAAEAELREIWGGMLCVTAAERTEAELQAIADEIMATLPQRDLQMVVVDGMAGTVDVCVIHDDGVLQQRMDDAYGRGLVTVSSALRALS